jgi:hypothetical protein
MFWLTGIGLITSVFLVGLILLILIVLLILLELGLKNWLDIKKQPKIKNNTVILAAIGYGTLIEL